jgi:hypothetical protein
MKVRCREGYREGYSKMVRERSERRLKSKNLDSLSPGWHEDGGGLRFRVESKGSRTWVLRLTINGIRRNRGLGPYPLVTLDMARDRALDFRRAAREGRDLAQEERQKLARATTFRQAYEAYFENKARELQESRHLVQWPSMMNAYVLPKIGARPVGDITHADIIDVLKPIWFAKPETARRVLQRMHARRPTPAPASPRSLGRATRTSSTTAPCPMLRCRPSSSSCAPPRRGRPWRSNG